ncbi:MAG: hypothetical protein JSS66_11440 [Armatimonadetes bacterium]|nr:hypothetical protein [Armatimonadota bacterium]
MDGIGPLRGPEPQVSSRRPDWLKERRKGKPRPSSETSEEELEESEAVLDSELSDSDGEHHIDLEA